MERRCGWGETDMKTAARTAFGDLISDKTLLSLILLAI